MKTGAKVVWGGAFFTVLVEYDDEYVYLDTGTNNAQLVHISELEAA